MLVTISTSLYRPPNMPDDAGNDKKQCRKQHGVEVRQACKIADEQKDDADKSQRRS